MKLKLIKEQSVNLDSGIVETWFYIYMEDKIVTCSREEIKATKIYYALGSFLAEHGTHPAKETILESEIKRTSDISIDANAIDNLVSGDN